MTGGWCYVRMHRGRRTAPGYSRAKLRAWADRLASLGRGFVFFNNDQGASAPRDAATLIALMTERGASVDRPVQRAFPAR